MIKKAQRIITLNIIIPLTAGFLIYVFLKQGTHINRFLSLFEINFYMSVPDNLFFSVLKNWATDFLWAYALTFSMYSVLKKYQYGLILSAVSAFLLGAALETAQKTDIISGTFDIFDLAAEAFAVILSIIIIKGVQKNEKV